MRSYERSINFAKPRYIAAVTLAASALNLCWGTMVVAKSDTECLNMDASSAPTASATYDIRSGNLDTISGEVPDVHKDNYVSFIPNALKDPLVQLSLQNGDVTSVSASVSTESAQGLLRSSVRAESGMFNKNAHCGTEKEIALSFDPELASTPETGLFANEYNTRMLIVHEAIHGLNAGWWQRLQESKAFDSVQDPKLYELQNACDDVNKWLSYQNTGKMPQSIPYENDTSIADVCSTQIITMDTDPLREIFRCTNEGDMIKERRKLKATADLGHPWDNPTELASSITNLLKFDPGYVFQCFASQDSMDATLMMRYVKATLELSFAYKPELEALLRQDKNTSDAINFLLSAR